jgi:hypothetical protein
MLSMTDLVDGFLFAMYSPDLYFLVVFCSYLLDDLNSKPLNKILDLFLKTKNPAGGPSLK